MLVQLQQVVKVYGSRRIPSGLDWPIPDGARVGLVGANGSGKSTLLRIIDAQEAVDGGSLFRRRQLSSAYLPQHPPAATQSALEIVAESRSDLSAIDMELDRVAQQLGSAEAGADLALMQRLLERQERLLKRYEVLGGFGAEGEAVSTLLQLGLPEESVQLPLNQLSGGQRKLVYLAACLTRRPDLLLLDEPETHLDLKARGNMEDVIRRFDGAIVIVSHDRYLLDETVNHIAELEAGRLQIWPGNYSAYRVNKEISLRWQEELYVTQQKEIARLEEAVKRFELWASMVVAERHIKQARNKQRQIARMDKVERPVLERRKIALRLTEERRSGQKVMELRHLDASFDGFPLLRNIEATIWRCRRVGLIGPNGAGKSLLARILAQQMEPIGGTVWLGPSVSIGYFAQHQGGATLEGGTPVDLIRAVRPMREDQAVGHLMKFLFSYEQLRQPIASLSGGEQSRLRLLSLMLSAANCLVLDEPTNHLDIESMEALKSALDTYPGTVVMVSQGRYFLDRTVDEIWQIADGRLLSFRGGYSEWATRNL